MKWPGRKRETAQRELAPPEQADQAPALPAAKTEVDPERSQVGLLNLVSLPFPGDGHYRDDEVDDDRRSRHSEVRFGGYLTLVRDRVDRDIEAG